MPLHLAALLLGLVVLTGWAAKIEVLTTLGIAGTMKPFTAVFFVLMGLGGLVQTLWPDRFRGALFSVASVVFLLAALFMFQNVSGRNTGIEAWLFGEQLRTINPQQGGLVALGTATAFLFVAASHLSHLTGRFEVAAWVLLVPLCVGAIALIGYAYGVRELYEYSSVNAVGLHTAIGLCALTVGTWCSLRHNRVLDMITSSTPHARALRRIGPPLILVPFLLGIVEVHLIRDETLRPGMASAAMTLTLILVLGALLAWHLFTMYREQSLRAAVEADREDYMHRLAENEERLRLALSGGNIGWWELDPRTRNNRMAPETAALFGLPRDATRSTLDIIRACIHPDDRERWERAFERACQTKGPYNAEYRVVWPDGSIHWIASRGRIVRDQNQQPERVIGVVADITERRRAEEALRESEQRFRRIFETANEGIWLLDAEGRIQLVNPRLAEMLGWPEEQMLGKRGSEFALPDDAGFAERQFEQRRQQYSGQFEIRLRHRDGHEVWTLFAARALFEEGKFIGVLDMITDITERKRTELELASAQEKLREHARTLEERVAERTAALHETIAQLEAFSYSITHDMRGPLRAISGFAGILEHDFGPRLDDTAHNYLHRMTSAAQRLDSLIQDVLDFSRLSKGEMTLEPIDLAELIGDIVHQYPNLLAEKTHITVGCVDFKVQANLAALTQVISNLLGNALKFMPHGRTPCVEIKCELVGNSVRVWVIDNGIGIAPEYREKIWGAFQRLHQTEEYPGTGIGLAIVKKAIERMGGRVGVESESGKGSRFWFELQRA